MERIYNVPLRREFQKAPNYKKAPKAMRALKEFLKKHMKSDSIIIGKHLNQEIWKNGPRNPPPKVSIKAVKEEDKVKAELVNYFEETFKEKEESKKKTKKKKEVKEEIKTPESVKEKKSEEVPKTGDLKKEEKKIMKKTEKVPEASELAKKKK